MTLRKTLISGAAALGIAVTNEQADACLVYLVELEKWNRKINLTSITGEQEIITRHFIDSLSYLRGFDPKPGNKLLDMGSGAGFPALPIKIASPDLSVVLVESVRKKGAFLRHIIRTLGLKDVTVIDLRTDQLAAEHRGRYDIVTARAFAEMGAALREGAVFLKPGGRLVLSRGETERVSADAAAACGLMIETRQELLLPGSGDPRALWVFRRNA